MASRAEQQIALVGMTFRAGPEVSGDQVVVSSFVILGR
jgi:hypothetical protein